MKWTRRDSVYAVALLLLSGVLIWVLFGRTLVPHHSEMDASLYDFDARAIPEVETSQELQEYLDKGYRKILGPDGKWMIAGGEPGAEKLDENLIAMGIGETKSVRIIPGMTPEELSEALGIRVEDLPPRVREKLLKNAEEDHERLDE